MKAAPDHSGLPGQAG